MGTGKTAINGASTIAWLRLLETQAAPIYTAWVKEHAQEWQQEVVKGPDSWVLPQSDECDLIGMPRYKPSLYLVPVNIVQ